MKQIESSDDAFNLLARQRKNWPLVDQNYHALENIKVKEFKIDNYTFKVQFNSARIASSSARTDDKSIKERECFLCPENLPDEQQGLAFGTDYQVLINPYPIFPAHFTISVLKHQPQRIYSRFKDLLHLANILDDFVVFYNGPRSGASAPDHAHFQAGNKGFLPIMDELERTDYQRIIYTAMDINVFTLNNDLRETFVIKIRNENLGVRIFNMLYHLLETELSQNQNAPEEPMMNILVSYEKGEWTIVLFPRVKHRPSYYFAEGNERLLISPGAVDMAGVLITPREEDFEKITAENIRTIFTEVSPAAGQVNNIIGLLKEQLCKNL